jgi:dUTP pyrophosphatase
MYFTGDKKVFMIPVKLKVKEGARVPDYQSNGAAGADLYAHLESPLVIEKGKTVLVPTGIFIELPEGYEAQIRPRSGLALKHGLTLLNSPGTIDWDYRGEIKVIVTNLGESDFVVENGMRIAQIIFSRVYKGDFIVTEELMDTERGHGGFGHTGI